MRHSLLSATLASATLSPLRKMAFNPSGELNISGGSCTDNLFVSASANPQRSANPASGRLPESFGAFALAMEPLQSVHTHGTCVTIYYGWRDNTNRNYLVEEGVYAAAHNP